MFLVAAYDFAGTIIIDIVRTENGFGIVRSEWIEFLQVAEEFRSDVSEINLGIDVDDLSLIHISEHKRLEVF